MAPRLGTMALPGGKCQDFFRSHPRNLPDIIWYSLGMFWILPSCEDSWSDCNWLQLVPGHHLEPSLKEPRNPRLKESGDHPSGQYGWQIQLLTHLMKSSSLNLLVSCYPPKKRPIYIICILYIYICKNNIYIYTCTNLPFAVQWHLWIIDQRKHGSSHISGRLFDGQIRSCLGHWVRIAIAFGNADQQAVGQTIPGSCKKNGISGDQVTISWWFDGKFPGTSGEPEVMDWFDMMGWYFIKYIRGFPNIISLVENRIPQTMGFWYSPKRIFLKWEGTLNHPFWYV